MMLSSGLKMLNGLRFFKLNIWMLRLIAYVATQLES